MTHALFWSDAIQSDVSSDSRVGCVTHSPVRVAVVETDMQAVWLQADSLQSSG